MGNISQLAIRVNGFILELIDGGGSEFLLHGCDDKTSKGEATQHARCYAEQCWTVYYSKANTARQTQFETWYLLYCTFGPTYDNVS